ncbi:MAG: LLM class flavin-dependent oxidoreductase [Gammaproteobacteria bacterium]|nr:LLM class flavin-dependent oxidoreductase [Gammaproteobacteria bacterium]
MAISLGVHLGQQNIPMPELRALWRKLDAHGVDWISLRDHLYEAPFEGGGEPHFEALAALGALAAETTNARIGCLVFYIGYRNPALLAKAAITLDHISGGRFELGIGAGWHVWEAYAYGYPFPDIGTRLDMLDEAAEVIHRMFTQDQTTFSGRHFQVDDASCLPKPAGRRLPIWIGGLGERRTLEIAARRADGWNAAYVNPEEYRRLNSVLDHWCEVNKRDPSDIRRGANVAFALAMNDSGARIERRRLLALDSGQRLDDGALTGTPDTAVEQVMRYVEAGAQDINVLLQPPWDEDALNAYLEDVIPAVHRETGAAPRNVR